MIPISLYCTINLDPPIICVSDALGVSIPITVGGVSGSLEMPNLPDWSQDPHDPLRMPLKPPQHAETWKQGDERMQWGFPFTYPSADARVSRVLLHFQSTSENLHEAATAIDRDIPKWYANFIDYFELVTKQRREPSMKIFDRLQNIDLFYWGSDRKPHRPSKNCTSVEIYEKSRDRHLTQKTLETVCSLASSAKSVSLEHRIQLEAYRAIYQDDYRKAIIETAVAAELAITIGLRRRFESDQVVYGNKLLKKFRMLGGRFELARIVGLELPARDWKKDLIEPRNSVIHGASFIDQALALRAVDAVDELLISLCPSYAESKVAVS